MLQSRVESIERRTLTVPGPVEKGNGPLRTRFDVPLRTSALRRPLDPLLFHCLSSGYVRLARDSRTVAGVGGWSAGGCKHGRNTRLPAASAEGQSGQWNQGRPSHSTAASMARTRNAVERQKVAAVESALFNPDVVFLLAALLDARDLRQASLTCKALGAKQAAVYNGLSLVEEAARRLFECASEWERSCLTKHDGEGWVELYHHLLILRSKLTFNQLVGNYIQYGADQSTVCARGNARGSSALCSDHKMRSGRHFAVFTTTGSRRAIGVVRPVQISRSDFGGGRLDVFNPAYNRFWGHLRGKRTDRWGDSNVHCCYVTNTGYFSWYDWTSHNAYSWVDGFQRGIPIGLLLELDDGTLLIYQRGQKLATLKDGLSGEYCWYARTFVVDDSISIDRGPTPNE